MTNSPQSALRSPPSAYALTALVVCLYGAARVWRLTATCLWFDEIFSVHAARHAWGDLWRFAAADLIHPPLFYALLKLWTAAGGESLLWLRLFPLLNAIAALVPFLLLARELRLGAWATNLALLVAASNGYLIKYAQEVRMYSLLLLLTLTSLWLCARLLNSAKLSDSVKLFDSTKLSDSARLPNSAKLINSARHGRGLLLALFAANLLLVYTHYYGWLVVACEAALLLFRDRRRLGAFLLTVAGLALAYVPWVWACVGAGDAAGAKLAQNIGWIARPRAADLVQLFALFNQPFYFRQSSADPLYARGGALLGLLLFGLPIFALLLSALHRGRRGRGRAEDEGSESQQENETQEENETQKQSKGARHDGDGRAGAALAFLMLFTTLPVALAFAASYALPQSVWGTRHLIVAAAPYALLAGTALERLRPFFLRTAALMLLGCWLAAVGALNLLRPEGVYVWCAWEGLASSAARDEASAPSSVEAGAALGTRDAAAHALEEDAAHTLNVYAFEDLVAYHLWFALGGEEGAHRFRVVSVKGVPGIAEDPAYFLPRGFDGISTASTDSLKGESFWVAFRDEAWDESRQPLRFIMERGYRAERVYEAGAQGQRAFLVLFKRTNP
ncbi:MAG: mannosyltransferase [Acidobacteriota bacterium]|nr:mannosyltransferase [Acidobacteriota bacterium]